jgi:CubicO group peptidase (beta-lactamase class C family)
MLLPRAYGSSLRRVLAEVLPNPAGSDQAEPGLNQLSLRRSVDDALPALVGAVDDCRSALRDPDGVHAGSYGLALTARDMVKIGELWLNGGVWQGRRILDADYITQASTNQVPELEGKIRGYGYLWWITPLARHGAYSAQGRYGQLITVVPDLQAVIVISSRALDTAPSIDDHLAMMDAAIVPGLS